MSITKAALDNNRVTAVALLVILIAGWAPTGKCPSRMTRASSSGSPW